MSDDNKNANYHSFDREPATGDEFHKETTEHADLRHRIEADTHDEHLAADTAARQDAPVATRPEAFQPAVQPVAPAPEPVSDLPNPGPGLMVLQWLVYALWGWAVLALSFLIAIVVGQLLSADDTSSRSVMYGDSISYMLAAVIVLFVIALACDVFYARAERKHAKTTGTNVIMIIHAVIFALFGIGALIASVFGGVSLMVGEATDTSGAVSTIISGAVIFGLYGATLLRTLRPRWINGVASLYWVFMTIAVLISIVLGVMGPAAQARLGAEDRIITENLPSLAEAINAHASDNGSLPRSLSELKNLDEYGDEGDMQKMIDQNLVKYTPGERLTNESQEPSQIAPGADQMGGTVKTIYHYELCVTYKTASGYGDSYSTGKSHSSDQRYDTYITTYEHPKGEKCYDIQTDFLY